MEENSTYRWPGNEPQPEKPKKAPNIGRIVKTALVVVLALTILVSGLTCFYTVSDKQQAVVTTFGKVTDVADAGVHFKLPFGIQQVKKVDVNVYQQIQLGYTGNDYTNESSMITGDYNIVNVDFFVEYKISDPVQYLYSSNDPVEILRNLIQSQVRNVVGSSTVDAVLTDGKENIQMQVKELVTGILEEYDIGLTLVDVKIQDAEPPTVEVVEAFKAVETAKQQAETVINDAKAYQNAQLPKAQAEADKLIQNAEYLKQKRVNEAVEQVAMFTAMYEQYQENPAITRSRMYYETISEVLPDVKLYINSGAGSGSDVQAQADKLIQNAEYLKQKRINEAVEAVAMFNAMYAEYQQNQDITLTRMYYEAISEILPGVKLYINTSGSSDVQMLLPLETIVGSQGGK